jgi:hypothetical protein
LLVVLDGFSYLFYFVVVLENFRSFMTASFPSRRSFLWSLAGFGLSTRGLRAERKAEQHFRFRTPDCDVRMSVEFLLNSSGEGFRFRDRLTNQSFCLSSTGERNAGCVEQFVGAMAIAQYAFHARRPLASPRTLRERVLTIDNDSHMAVRPPFERTMPVERETVSDIQTFGYNPNDPQPAIWSGKLHAPWRLLRQDLFLNGQPAAFLVLHWKHALDGISLVDVIPGDDTMRMH